MAQSLTSFLQSIQPALLWLKLQSFIRREIQGNNGQNYPNTDSLTASTTTCQAEPDIEAGLHLQQGATYARDNNSPAPSPTPAPQKELLPTFTRRSASSHSCPSPLSTTSSPNSIAAAQEVGLNPIAQVFSEQELGKTIIGFMMPLIAAFLTPYAPTSLLVRIWVFLSLSVGFAVLWNGILLRNVFPRRANVVEQIGAVLMIMAVFGLISSFLPSYLVWIPWVSFLVVLFPHFLGLLFGH